MVQVFGLDTGLRLVEGVWVDSSNYMSLFLEHACKGVKFDVGGPAILTLLYLRKSDVELRMGIVKGKRRSNDLDT